MEIHRLGGYVNVVDNTNKKELKKKFVEPGTPMPPKPSKSIFKRHL